MCGADAAAPASVAPELTDAPALHKPVTLAVAGRPLDEALTEVSRQTGVDFTTAHALGDQRVTLFVTAEPLGEFMRRMTGLLSHDPAHPHGYHWETLTRPAGAHPAYRLWRDLSSLAEEDTERDYPRRKVVLLLRQFRDVVRLPLAERAKFPTDLNPGLYQDPDNQPFWDSFKGLTDAQIDALVHGVSVPLSPDLFPAQVAVFQQKWRASALADQQRLRSGGGRDPYPNGIPDPPPAALKVDVDDQGGEWPVRATWYGIHLQGVQILAQGDTYLSLDPLDNGKPPFPPTPAPPAPVIDLTPLLTAPGVTKRQRGDLAFTLATLARAAHVPICEKHFLRTTVFGDPTSGLQTLKGSLPDLINAICDHWRYTAVKQDDTYVFWSRSWAEDRSEDIPERLLARWRARLKTQGSFTLSDRVEMAGALTWPQWKITLAAAIPEVDTNGGINLYRGTRFLADLSPLTRQSLLAGQPVALAALSAAEQQSFAAQFLTSTVNVSGQELDRAPMSLSVKVVTDAQEPFTRATLTVATPDHTLFFRPLGFSMPKPTSSP